MSAPLTAPASLAMHSVSRMPVRLALAFALVAGGAAIGSVVTWWIGLNSSRAWVVSLPAQGSIPANGGNPGSCAEDGPGDDADLVQLAHLAPRAHRSPRVTRWPSPSRL